MNEQSIENKRAWEHKAYEFWLRQGTPSEKAAQLIKNPRERLRYHQAYFEHIEGLKIANPCGSNGRIAVPLALLGAEVTVFDISQENARYALELAACAQVKLHYVIGDFLETDTSRYGGLFDIVYAEGGILHYFADLNAFMKIMYDITKTGGQMILCDFHPFRKINRKGSAMMSVPQTEGDYFDDRLHMGDVAYQHFFDKEEQASFPKCSLRLYTISEMINAVIQAGFVLKAFHEHPNFEDKKLPGELTIVAHKN